jgi:formate hydrogenlyase subunit 4
VILSDLVLQVCQVLCVLLLAPLLQGFIPKTEERVQRSRGPSVFQPYRDLWKLFHKEAVVPESASWIYFAAPIVAFTAMTIVPILIPVLTDRPLPLSDMGDMLGAKAMLPFVVNHLLLSSLSVYWSPAHVFLILGFFALLLVETDRLPIHSSTHIEIYMIDEARILEYSGPLLALLKWASMMKQFILHTIFCNVFVLPWGISQIGTPLGEIGSVATLLLKFLLVAMAVVVVETVQSRLRFYRYQEPLAAGFLFAVVAVVSSQLL